MWHNGKWEYIDQRSLSTFLKNNTEYNGGAVRLVSCSTGAKSDGIARQLSNKLGVNVLAPSDTLASIMFGANDLIEAARDFIYPLTSPQMPSDNILRDHVFAFFGVSPDECYLRVVKM